MMMRQWFTREAWAKKVAAASQPELEQPIIRVAFGVVILASLVWYISPNGQASEVGTKALTAMLIYLAVSIAILISTVWTGHVSVFRRYVGILVDVAAITCVMAMMGEAGAGMFGLYLFIIFGNGFRYGRV
jgi:two-component system sensor histidine kinase RpfC